MIRQEEERVPRKMVDFVNQRKKTEGKSIEGGLIRSKEV